MRLIIDASSVLAQFLFLKDEEFGVDITYEGEKYHIPSLETCIERAEESFQYTIDKLGIEPQNIIIVKDPEETGAARKRKFPFYKSKRGKRPKQYYDIFNPLVTHMCEFVMKSGGISATPRVVPAAESDDLIYELCKRLPETTIWSQDKDMLAVPATRHYIGGEVDPIKFPVPQDLIVLYRSIVTGDTSDSIPSAKGFGEKAWQELFDLVGPDGLYELKKMVEERRLHELADDVPHMKKLQILIDQAETVYQAYECMSPIHIPAHKVKYEARCQETTKELVTKLNFDRVYNRIKALYFDHSVIDYETDVPPESKAWLDNTRDSSGKGGVGVDVIASEITGMGLKIGPEAWYFSVDHKDTDNISLEDLESVLQLIKDKRCYAHNSSSFENVVTYNHYGYFLEGMFDTKLMASYVNENDFMGLKHLSKRDLGYEQTTYAEIIGDRSGMREVTGEEVLSYGIDDVITCDALQNLYTVIMQYEGTYGAFMEYDYESAFVTSLAFAEGCGFDAEQHATQKKANDENIVKAEKELDDLLVASGFGEDVVYKPLPELPTKSTIAKLFEAVTGKKLECGSIRTVKSIVAWLRENGYLEVADAVEKGYMDEVYRKHWTPKANLNVRSPKQIQELLYNHLQIPVRIRNKTTEIMRKKGIREGSPASNEEAMMNAIAFGDVDAEGKAILEKLLEYKGYLTKESLFFAKWNKFVHWKTNKIHINMTQCGTTTRRFTHTPNGAQLPKRKGREVRNMLKSIEGFSLLANDFSAQELRLQAEECQCKEMLACYIGDNKKDIHSATAFQVAAMQGLDEASYEEYYAKVKAGDKDAKALRSIGKAVVFASAYGCASGRLSHMLGVPEETAQLFLDAKAKAFPGLVPHVEEYNALCRKRKYSETRGGGRRHLAKMYAMAKNDYETSKVDRLAWSFRIQGAGAEQVKLAMARLWRSGIYKTKDVSLVLCVHDELVHQIRDSRLEELVPMITRTVCGEYAGMKIPAESTPEVGKNFGSLSEFQLAISE